MILDNCYDSSCHEKMHCLFFYDSANIFCFLVPCIFALLNVSDSLLNDMRPLVRIGAKVLVYSEHLGVILKLVT